MNSPSTKSCKICLRHRSVQSCRGLVAWMHGAEFSLNLRWSHSLSSSLFCGSWRACRRLMALARHLQHIKIENDTSRHSGQFRWPQSRHFTLRKGQSSRLTISWSDYFQSHCCHELGWVSREVDSKFTPPLGAPYLFFFSLQHNSHSIEFRV